MSHLSRSIFVLLGFAAIAFLVQISGVAQVQQNNDNADNAADADAAVDEGEKLLLKEPESAADVFDAAILYSDFGQLEQSKKYIEQLLEMNPSDAELLGIRDEHGTAKLLRLSNTKDLQPASVELLKRVTKASQKNATDPTRIDGVINDLFSNDVTKERIAQIELRNIGLPAVPRVITRLAATTDRVEGEKLLFAMLQMGDAISPAVIGALETPNEKLQTDLINILGFLRSEDAIPDLKYFAFSASQPPGTQMAARRALARVLYDDVKLVNRVSGYGTADDLQNVAVGYFSRKQGVSKLPAGDPNDRVDVWLWENAQNTVVAENVSVEAAANFHAVRHAKRALGFAPNRNELQTLFLSAVLADEAYRKGWDQPARIGPGTPFNLAMVSGEDSVLDSLQLAMDHGRVGAATILLDVIAEIGTERAIHSSERKSSPLVHALNFPESRVQFKAAQAVLAINPKRTFTGSGRVVQILSQALNDDGRGQALIIDPNEDRAGTLASTLSQIGYQATTALTGKDGFRYATERGNIDLIVMHVNTIQWELSPTIGNFKNDSRTSFVPIAISGPEFLRPTKQRLIKQYQRVGFLPETTSAPILATFLQPFVSSISTPPLTDLQRQQNRMVALQSLAQISTGQTHIEYDITKAETNLTDALNDNDLANGAMSVLSRIPTATAQTTIADILLAPATPIERRLIAGLELSNHIKRFGAQLSQQTVQQIETAWQQEQSPEVRTAMAAVVGSLQPKSEWTSSKLQAFDTYAKPAGM